MAKVLLWFEGKEWAFGAAGGLITVAAFYIGYSLLCYFLKPEASEPGSVECLAVFISGFFVSRAVFRIGFEEGKKKAVDDITP